MVLKFIGSHSPIFRMIHTNKLISIRHGTTMIEKDRSTYRGLSFGMQEIRRLLTISPSPAHAHDTTRSKLASASEWKNTFTAFHTYSFWARCCSSCEFTQRARPGGVSWPRLPYWFAFVRWPELVLQDDGIDTVSALHATKGLEVWAGVIQIIVPLGHEQARAASAGSRAELLARWKGLNSMPTSGLFHRSTTRRVCWFHFLSHDSASRLVRTDVHCLQNVTGSWS